MAPRGRGGRAAARALGALVAAAARKDGLRAQPPPFQSLRLKLQPLYLCIFQVVHLPSDLSHLHCKRALVNYWLAKRGGGGKGRTARGAATRPR